MQGASEAYFDVELQLHALWVLTCLAEDPAVQLADSTIQAVRDQPHWPHTYTSPISFTSYLPHYQTYTHCYSFSMCFAATNCLIARSNLFTKANNDCCGFVAGDEYN